MIGANRNTSHQRSRQADSCLQPPPVSIALVCGRCRDARWEQGCASSPWAGRALLSPGVCRNQQGFGFLCSLRGAQHAGMGGGLETELGAVMRHVVPSHMWSPAALSPAVTSPERALAASGLLLEVLAGHRVCVGGFVGSVLSLPSALAAGSPEPGSHGGELNRAPQSICHRI